MSAHTYFCLLLAASVCSSLSATLTANRDKLDRFAEAFAKRDGPLRILSFGDSMADSYRSVASHLVSRMLEKKPFAGTSFNNSFNHTLFNTTNATMVPPSHFWFSY